MSTPKRGGGRKPVILDNPFVEYDEWGDPHNTLWFTEDELDIRIEDILVGCIRAFNAGSTAKQEYVNWQKLLRIYRNVTELTRQNIQNYLMCSETTAKRYVQVIKLCNPFLIRLRSAKISCSIRGYIDLTHGQVESGYLTIL